MASREMLDKEDFNNALDFYSKTGRKFIVERCGNSSKIKFAGQEYYYYSAEKLNPITGNVEPNKMPIRQVHHINMVKNHIIKNGLHESIPKNYTKETDIHFIGWNKKKKAGETFKKCYCVDISGAYWQSALMQGYINKEIYEIGLTLDKRVRLACLGTFAKVKYIWECENGVTVLTDFIEPTHPQVFFNCANHIYRVMAACQKAVGDDFLFFWTDCVNVSSLKALKTCQQIIKQNKFDYHSQKLDYVKFTPTALLVGGKSKKEKRYNIDITTDTDTILEKLKREVKKNMRKKRLGM